MQIRFSLLRRGKKKPMGSWNFFVVVLGLEVEEVGPEEGIDDKVT